MSTAIVCANCRRPQIPHEEAGRLTCPDCSAALARAPEASGSSALDFPEPGPARPSGSITLLRSGLRNEEKNQQAGWMESLFARRGKPPAGQGPTPAVRPDREPDQGPANPWSPTRSTRIDSPYPGEDASRPAPAPADRADAPRRSEPGVSSDRGGSPADRFPIAGLVGSLLVVAISCVAVFQGRQIWASFLFLVTVALLGASVLGILHRRGSRRASWQGFALFGWGYLAMAFAPWPAHRPGLELPTAELVTTLHAKYAVPARDVPGPSPESTAAPKVAPKLPGSEAAGLEVRPPQAASMFVAGDLDQSLMVGHCLFALVAALLGSGVARWFQGSDPGPA